MMRLLFVDDDQRLLQGLRQGLRSQRRTWEMEFVECAGAALECLRERPFDAVISDMRMPCIDGAELLKRVRLLQPDALRVVLSGQMDELAAARAAARAHRFLAKPIETEVLIAELRRTLNLREQFHSDQMRRCVGGMGVLPSLPETCSALNDALQRPSTSTLDVARIVGGDVAMAAKVLQLVNSAFFGLPRRVLNIEQAVRYLGVGALRSLVMADSLFEQLGSGDRGALEAAQSRALLVARVVRQLSLSAPAAEAAATAALLHNIGDVALLSRLPDEYRASAALSRLHATSKAEAERARLGVTSAEVGAYLLSLWGLPFEVIEAVSSQLADPNGFALLDANAAVWLASTMASEALDDAADPRLAELEAVAVRLGVAPQVASVRQELAASFVERKAS